MHIKAICMYINVFIYNLHPNIENTSPVTVTPVEDSPIPCCIFRMDNPNITARIPPMAIQIKDKDASAIHPSYRKAEMNEIKLVIFILENI